MSTQFNLRDHAYQFFLEEAPELLQTIESGLLALRQERNIAEIHQIMRAAHSLKGAAASVGLEPIKAIAHRLEALFKALYSEGLTIDSGLEDGLLRAFDCLRLPLTTQLTEGRFDEAQALAAAEPVLQALEIQLASAIAETENFIPSSSDLGFDMATAIFEVDVQQGLDRLVEVLTEPTAHEVAGELRAQAEIFMGFAELLDLSGFAQIAQTTLQALAMNPDRAVEIAQIAVEDFRAGRQAVLGPQPSTGGEPSVALLGLAQSRLEIVGSPSATTKAWPDDFRDDLPDEAEALEWLMQAQERPDWRPDRPFDGPPPNQALDPDQLDLAMADISPVHPTAPMAASLEDMFAGLEPALASAPELLALAPSEPTAREEAQALLAPNSGLDISPAEISPAEISPAEISPPEVLAEASPATPEFEARPLPTGMTVRVDTQRLARLENQLGELTINRNGLALQTNQIRLGLKELISRFERVRATVEQLQTISDQILIAPERQRQPIPIAGGRLMEPAAAPAVNRLPDFDSLEMDSYTALYTYTQTLLEEMVQLEESAADVSLFNRQSDQLLGQQRKMLGQVQDDLMYARMVTIGQVFNRLPRVLRDLSNTYGKPAELSLEGTDLLVEKAVLEKLYTPLLHLLRNGFDHGLESLEERLRQGKPEVGQIIMRAYSRGRQVIIEVNDDGRGLDVERVRRRVVDLGWLSRPEAREASTEQLCRYIFEPGFSTADQVSDLSGRGIGLDVVKEQLRLLKGTVTVQSEPGQGTQFILAFPMTLSLVNLLICFIGSTPLALRSDSITEILVPQPGQLEQSAGQSWLTWRDRRVPVYPLGDLLPYRCLRPEMPLSQVLAAVPAPADWAAPVLILAQGEQFFALQVDRLVTEQESVIKPFGPALTPPPYAYGCTVLGDGSLIPVIDGQAFLDNLLNRPLAAATAISPEAVLAAISTQARQGDGLKQATLTQATTVLVVDDAVTSRRTLALSLERAGYRVLQARDGQDALDQLQQTPAVRLVVCDIEMPNMNGFEFLTQRRQSPELAEIPTIMLTSRSNDKHRWLALQLGATDYFTKPYLEQEFLGAINSYLQSADTTALDELHYAGDTVS